MPARALFFISILASAVPAAWAHDGTESQIEILTLRIYMDPGNAVLYQRRAELERAEKKWELARVDYRRAMQLRPVFQAALLGEALTWLGEGNAFTACQLIDSFLIRMPDNIEGLRGKARCLAVLHRSAESVEAFTRVIELTPEPRPETFMERSDVLVRDGLGREAIASLDDGIRRLGALVSLQLPAIELDLKLGLHADAVSRLTALIGASARPETWLARRADVFESMGNTNEARNDRLAAVAAIADLSPYRRADRSTMALLTGLKEKLN